MRERTRRQKINGDKCWKTGERKWETKRVDIVKKEKTVNSKREEIKSAITNKGVLRITKQKK